MKNTTAANVKTVCFYFDADELCDAEKYCAALQMIPWQKRIEKADAYHFGKDKRLSIAAGLLMLYAFAQAGVNDVELVYGEYGKPFLANNESGVYFNCSHSGTMAVCAVSNSPVGVDIESVSAFDERVVQRFFTAREQNEIKKDERTFYKFWTRKESFMKFLGTGMMLNSRGVDVTDGSPLLEDCAFSEYTLNGSYITVCGKKCEGLVKVSFDDIKEI